MNGVSTFTEFSMFILCGHEVKLASSSENVARDFRVSFCRIVPFVVRDGILINQCGT